MKSPKLLPWHANKAGVSLERAETLWKKAVREATAETGWVGTAEYWGAAEARFLDLLDEEKNSLCHPNVQPFVRSQHRMGLQPLLAAEEMISTIAANWQRFCNPRNRAA